MSHRCFKSAKNHADLGCDWPTSVQAGLITLDTARDSEPPRGQQGVCGGGTMPSLVQAGNCLLLRRCCGGSGQGAGRGLRRAARPQRAAAAFWFGCEARPL